MSLVHYFSRDPNKKAKFIFNTIAPIYAKVDKKLVEGYEQSIETLTTYLNIKGKTVLDIGTGTGAWAAIFHKSGAKKVTGVDFSKKMLAVSKEKHPEINFIYADAENLSDFNDNSFDIVTASFVIHGVTYDRRNIIINEMKRIAKEAVIIHDFVGKTPLFIRFLEFMEQSDYKHFKKNFKQEFDTITGWNIQVIPLKYGSGLYIALNN